LLVQVSIALGGIALLSAVAYYISWSKRQDKVASKGKATPVNFAVIHHQF
jgi:hypothetical protein